MRQFYCFSFSSLDHWWRVHHFLVAVMMLHSGSFTLKFREKTTVLIPYNAPASGDEMALAGTVGVTIASSTISTTSDLSSTVAAGDEVGAFIGMKRMCLGCMHLSCSRTSPT
jgi:hypothetical protein